MNHPSVAKQASECAILAAEIDRWNRQMPGLITVARDAENAVTNAEGRQLELERRIEQLQRAIEAANTASNFPDKPGYMGSAGLIGATIALANAEAALPRAKVVLQRAILQRDAADRNTLNTQTTSLPPLPNAGGGTGRAASSRLWC